MRKLDVSNAFLHGVLKEEVYMAQPQDYVDPAFPKHVCLLHKALYGLKQAPRAWFERFTSQLLHIGFCASAADGNLFILRHGSSIVFLLLYVDDIIITGNRSSFVSSVIKLLGVDFDLKDLELLHYFLGLQVDYTSSRLFVHQTKYASDLLKKFGMTDCKPCKTPSSPNSHFLPNDSPLLSDPTTYRSLVGALQYLSFTRPDLSFAVQQACQYMSTPTQNNLQAAKHILRYLQGTLHFGIAFTPGPISLSAYYDSDWARDPVDRCSLTSMVLFFGNCPISWFAKKQGIVSRSSTEAEYRALASTTIELYWIRMLLRDFGLFLPHPPLLWCDNVSALTIATNPVFHARTKHIELDYHFVHEKVLRRDLLIKFISTHDQLADLFTKGLLSPWFNWLTSKLMWKFPIRLRGDESHGSASSSGGPEDSNQEQEEETPTATSNIKTLSCIRLGKHKAKLKQNAIISH